nr:cupin-like domain-containing protein [uncultured Chitinophaga sp.]
MRVAANIDTVSVLSDADFNTSYYNRKPVIIKGGLAGTTCFRKWSVDYLKEKIGSTMVRVAYTEKGSYNYAIREVKWIGGHFDEVSDLFSLPAGNGPSYYLAQLSIPGFFPALMDDLDIPAFIGDDDILDKVNLWMGGAGCDSGLHYDNSHNFFYQVCGRKEMVLFSPEDTPLLYPSQLPGKWHMSEAELNDADVKKFPLISEATPYHCIVEPGDIIYIPTGWWHNVLSLDMSISVNFWWHRFDIPIGKGVDMFGVSELSSFLQRFLQKGMDIDRPDAAGEPMLLRAIEKGHVNFAHALLQLGASLTSVNRKGESPFECARNNGHPEITALLLEHAEGQSKKKLEKHQNSFENLK